MTDSRQTNNRFVCPACKGQLQNTSQLYHCKRCNRDFPVIFGIPDFRLRSDRYLSLEEERKKASRIASSPHQTFSKMLDYYYQITDDVPDELAARYKAYHTQSPLQAKHGLEKLSLKPTDKFLDAGCGTGGTLISASRYCSDLVGVDIALRWLILCKQRLQEAGVEATLICADVEALPFASTGFDKIVANDLLENVYSVNDTLRALSQQLNSAGTLWLSGSNRFCIGPHPSTRLWAIGYLPRYLRSSVVKYFRGVDSLRFINLIEPHTVSNDAQTLGLRLLYLSPKKIHAENHASYPWVDRQIIKFYRYISRVPILAWLLLLVGPAFEMILYKPHATDQKTHNKIL